MEKRTDSSVLKRLHRTGSLGGMRNHGSKQAGIISWTVIRNLAKALAQPPAKNRCAFADGASDDAIILKDTNSWT